MLLYFHKEGMGEGPRSGEDDRLIRGIVHDVPEAPGDPGNEHERETCARSETQARAIRRARVERLDAEPDRAKNRQRAGRRMHEEKQLTHTCIVHLKIAV